MTNCYRDLGRVIGEKSFEKVTAHGGRACLITYSLAHAVTVKAICQQTRHKNESGMQPYRRLDEHSHKIFQDVLQGVFGKEDVSDDDEEDRKMPATKGLTKKSSRKGIKGRLSSCDKSVQESEPSEFQKLQVEIKQLRREIAESKPSKRTSAGIHDSEDEEENGHSSAAVARESLEKENKRMKKTLENLGYGFHSNAIAPNGVSIPSYGTNNIQYVHSSIGGVVFPYPQGFHNPMITPPGQMRFTPNFDPSFSHGASTIHQGVQDQNTGGVASPSVNPMRFQQRTRHDMEAVMHVDLNSPDNLDGNAQGSGTERSKSFFDVTRCILM